MQQPCTNTKYSKPSTDPYTDGSELDNKTGCGEHTTLGKRVIYNGNFYLGNTTTVFQADVKAIQKSAEMLLNKTENPVSASKTTRKVTQV